MTTSTIEHPKVVSRAEWLAARKDLLAEEKALTRARDALSAKRRELPWVQVDKEYVFDTPDGKKTLADLFDGRSQLIVYHFMWRRELGEGCVGCSFLADHVDGPNQHLARHDVSFVVVSRAPLPLLEAFKKRMGWRFNWVSSHASDFNFDYHVSFTPEELATGRVFYNYRTTDASIEELAGMSVFYKDGTATSSIPIPAMAVVTRKCWARICISTLRRRAATRPGLTSPSLTGFGITTSMERRASSMRPAATSLLRTKVHAAIRQSGKPNG